MADYLARVLGGYKRMKDMGGGVHAEHQISTLAQPDGTVITTSLASRWSWERGGCMRAWNMSACKVM